MRSPTTHRRLAAALAALALTATLAACGSDTKAADTTAAPSEQSLPEELQSKGTITLLAYDSFVLSEDTLRTFTDETGWTVKVLTNGDTGELVNKAILTADAPLGDVLWGVDNTFLDRALQAGIFSPYASTQKAKILPELTELVPGDEVTPVDYGDVCINYDKAALAAKGVAAPTTLEQLVDPTYRNMLVVENPATSSPGLAFLLGTIAHFGDGWKTWWTKLKANGVTVVNGWTEAYEGEFSAGGKKGTHPLVVSYASSPPAAVLYGPDPKATEAPTGVLEASCFRQVEFAGVLKGTEHEAIAQRLVDFLASPLVQEDMQLNMFVFPANTDAQLADAFVKFAARPAKPLRMTPDAIAKGRDEWIDQWTSIVL